MNIYKIELSKQATVWRLSNQSTLNHLQRYLCPQAHHHAVTSDVISFWKFLSSPSRRPPKFMQKTLSKVQIWLCYFLAPCYWMAVIYYTSRLNIWSLILPSTSSTSERIDVPFSNNYQTLEFHEELICLTHALGAFSTSKVWETLICPWRVISSSLLCEYLIQGLWTWMRKKKLHLYFISLLLKFSTSFNYQHRQ